MSPRTAPFPSFVLRSVAITRARVVATFLLVLMFLPVSARAQMFGERTLGTPFGRRAKPGTSVGDVSGSERFVRGNRKATDFVGSDSRDPSTFVGAVQGTTTGQVRAAVEGLRRRPDNTQRLNPVFPPRSPQQMYPPRLEVGFPVTAQPADAIQASLSRSLRAVEGRFDRVAVSMSNRTARLTGFVGSAADKSLAEALVLFEPGVEGVRNELVVKPAEAPQGHRVPLPPQPRATP